MSIPPDTKDWTWVLDRRCDDCGFEPSAVVVTEIADTVRASLPRWTAALDRSGAAERPDPTTWSPTEYGCHVRDVLVVFRERLELMLTTDDPLFENWDQDATAAAERYDRQRPADVAPALVEAGERLAAVVDAVPDGAWERSGRRSNGSVFTVSTLLVYFLHDLVHHLHDVDA